MSYTPIAKMELPILGRKWRVYLYEGDYFVKLFGQDDAGVCITETRSIYFHEDELDLRTIRHELTHAYFDALCTSAAALTTSQQEEIFAEMVAEYGPTLIDQAKKIKKELTT